MRECGPSENGKKAAADYYNLVSELFAKNYFERLRAWCRKNNIASSGHLNGEHETLGCIKYGFNHVMRQLRCFDIPGINTIWRQIFPGRETTFSPDSRHPPRIRQGRPSFMPLIPAWRYLGKYNIYTARMSYAMSLGRPAVCHALYMPINDFWMEGDEASSACDSFDGIARYLERRHCPFDIIDDDFLETAEIKNGCLTTGTAAYEAVIIPECRPLVPESKKVLDMFASGGGTVIASHELDKIKPVAKINSDNISVYKKHLDNGALYLLVNEETERESFSVSFPEKGNVYELCADDGNIVPAAIPEVTLESGEGRIFLISDESFGPSGGTVNGNHCEELTKFEIRKTYGFKKGEQQFEALYYTDDYVRCVPGDWCSLFGDDFSGIAEYRMHFSLSRIPEYLQIDLGRVNYSCEVFLNGRSLGICCMSPYRCIAEKSLLKKRKRACYKRCQHPCQPVCNNGLDR